jgi:aspartate aminotransferase-like enzyme
MRKSPAGDQGTRRGAFLMRWLNVSAGQTMLSPGCREALSRQMAAPIYYPDYWTAELEAARLLQKLICTQSDVLILTGNATHAIEATLFSLLQPGDAILAINAGIFGQVFCQVAGIVGAKPIELKIPYGRSIGPEELERALQEHPQVKAVSLVHIETSTGVMAPLPELARAVRDHNKLLIVDAVSSLAAAPVHMDEWGVDVLLSSGQKALNAPQGLAILAVNERAWQRYAARSSPVASVCLDLGVWRDYRKLQVEASLAQWNGQKIITEPELKLVHGPSPSGPLVFGLLGALRDVFQEGPERVFQRHRIAARAVRAGVRALNLVVLADERVAAPSSTTAMLPESLPEFVLRQEVYRRYGIALGAGPVEIGLNAFRIGTMGFTAHPQAIIPVFEALGETLPELGHTCHPDAGVRAAKSVFQQESTLDLWETHCDPFAD